MGERHANDINENDIAACANGIDDDGDGQVDYPNDPGCDDVYDDTENDASSGGAGGAGGMGAGGDDTVGAGGAMTQGPPPDHGGVQFGEGGSNTDSGCGCRVAGHGSRHASLWLFLAAAALGLIRRRRRTQ